MDYCNGIDNGNKRSIECIKLRLLPLFFLRKNRRRLCVNWSVLERKYSLIFVFIHLCYLYLCDTVQCIRRFVFNFLIAIVSSFGNFRSNFRTKFAWSTFRCIRITKTFLLATFCVSYFCWFKAMVISIGLQANVYELLCVCETVWRWFLLWKYGNLMVINNARQSLVILSTSTNNKKCQNRLLHFAVAKWLIMERRTLHASTAAATAPAPAPAPVARMWADFCTMFRNYILPLQLLMILSSK